MFHRLAEVPGDGGHRGEKQVPEVMTTQPLALGKAILEKSRQQRLILGERHNAIAHISRSRDVQLLAQTTARTSIIADCHNGRQIAYAGETLRQSPFT